MSRRRGGSTTSDLTIPARNGAAVTPNDGTDLAVETRALLIGGAGNLSVIFADQTTAVLLTGVVAGALLPIAVKRVLATNTTATNITALW